MIEPTNKTKEEEVRLVEVPEVPAVPEKSEVLEKSEVIENPKVSSLDNEFPDLGERYEVLGQVGSGGMGTVWKVRDLSLDEILAIKILRPEMLKDETAVKRFEQEAKLATDLTHVNIASIYGPGKDRAGHPFIIMNFVDGESLADILAREGKFTEERAMDIFHQVCAALSHSHMKGVIHRDIKPSNIIISKTESGADCVHVVDFGIAKSIYGDVQSTQALTRTDDTFGSPLYMSPEQSLGEEVTERSDIYSLGCVLYEMLTGRPPFTEKNPVRLLVQHLNEPPNLTGLPFKIVGLLSLCLKKRPESRPANIDSILEYLDRRYPDLDGSFEGNVKFLGILPGFVVVLLTVIMATDLSSVRILGLHLLAVELGVGTIFISLALANSKSAIKSAILVPMANSLLAALAVVPLVFPVLVQCRHFGPPIFPIPDFFLIALFFPVYALFERFSLVNQFTNWRRLSQVEKKVAGTNVLLLQKAFIAEAHMALAGISFSLVSTITMILINSDNFPAKYSWEYAILCTTGLSMFATGFLVGVLAFWLSKVFVNFDLRVVNSREYWLPAVRSSFKAMSAWTLTASLFWMIFQSTNLGLWTKTHYFPMSTAHAEHIAGDLQKLPHTAIDDMARLDFATKNTLVPSSHKSIQVLLDQVINNTNESLPLFRATALYRKASLLRGADYEVAGKELLSRALAELSVEVTEPNDLPFFDSFAYLNGPYTPGSLILSIMREAQKHSDFELAKKASVILENRKIPLSGQQQNELKFLKNINTLHKAPLP